MPPEAASLRLVSKTHRNRNEGGRGVASKEGVGGASERCEQAVHVQGGRGVASKEGVGGASERRTCCHVAGG